MTDSRFTRFNDSQIEAALRVVQRWSEQHDGPDWPGMLEPSRLKAAQVLACEVRALREDLYVTRLDRQQLWSERNELRVELERTKQSLKERTEI